MKVVARESLGETPVARKRKVYALLRLEAYYEQYSSKHKTTSLSKTNAGKCPVLVSVTTGLG